METNEKYTYLGQCDKLRQTEEGERNWILMMNEAEIIDEKQFLSIADVKDFLEDQTISEFCSSDPHSKLCSSKWGNNSCVFIQTCGFEFIFSMEKFRQTVTIVENGEEINITSDNLKNLLDGDMIYLCDDTCDCDSYHISPEFVMEDIIKEIELLTSGKPGIFLVANH